MYKRHAQKCCHNVRENSGNVEAFRRVIAEVKDLSEAKNQGEPKRFGGRDTEPEKKKFKK